MKTVNLLTLFAIVTYVFSACNGNNAKLTSSSSSADSMSYAVGVIEASISKEKITQFKLDVNSDMFTAGVMDVMKSDSLPMPREKALEIINTYITGKHKIQNTEFLVKNAKEAGVKTTASGLQYKVIEEGTGKSPQVTDSVKIIYTGLLVDSTMFDSSRGEAVTMQLNGLIEGWKEGIPMMKEGGHFIFYIPSELGYGDAPGRIQPGSTLIFDVELKEVIAPK